MSETIGPTVWHGREMLVCTRCKYLRSQLVRSGRRPDYEFFCTHPQILQGTWLNDSAMVEKVKTLRPGDTALLKHFEQQAEERKKNRLAHGEFIGNDETTPEAPDWCPVMPNKRET